MPTVQPRGELQAPLYGFGHEWEPLRRRLLALPRAERQQVWATVDDVLPSHVRAGVPFHDALVKIVGDLLDGRKVTRHRPVGLGPGANMRPRPCVACGEPIPPTGKRGKPRLRHPYCGGTKAKVA